MVEKFFKKIDQNPYEELFFNVPETKMGVAEVIGGNSQSFQIVVRTAEFLMREFPLKEARVVLPESLRGKLPELPNLGFLPATEAGTFNGEGMREMIEGVDYSLVIGDLSKNKITQQAISKALGEVKRPVLVTRDAVDLIAETGAEKVFLNEKVSFLASAAQLQKILRGLYYPRVMTLSQPLLMVAEILHKFTLSYPVGIVTFYSGQILVAKGGEVRAVAMEKSGFSPITIWGGQLAAKILALNLYNPGKFLEASTAAIFGMM